MELNLRWMLFQRLLEKYTYGGIAANGNEEIHISPSTEAFRHERAKYFDLLKGERFASSAAGTRHAHAIPAAARLSSQQHSQVWQRKTWQCQPTQSISSATTAQSIKMLLGHIRTTSLTYTRLGDGASNRVQPAPRDSPPPPTYSSAKPPRLAPERQHIQQILNSWLIEAYAKFTRDNEARNTRRYLELLAQLLQKKNQ